MGRVNGKVAIVTGGVEGIGGAISTLLAREGAKVAVLDIQDAKGATLVSSIKSAGGTAQYWHVDVTAEADVARVFADVVETFGKLDVLVANAGIAGPNVPTHEVTLEDWNRTFAINSTAVFLCTKHGVPHMRAAGGGSIINMSSVYGLVGASDLPPYHASKGAVRCMTKNDALLYAADKIRVNSVHPGYIWTPMVERLGLDAGLDMKEFRSAMDAKHPVGHVGLPEDIANGVLFLASDETTFMTGSELVIDGGYTAG
ncbi:MULTISPECIES: SDR family NAD(P)-dependent oxidoreductase [unclassified Variovorax]|uniref:SDR family NAD(P)-dependent oxidoreductase n=1 Tax=unclassified Variovorax TaxID=663243 RepID=UPI003F4556DD